LNSEEDIEPDLFDVVALDFLASFQPTTRDVQTARPASMSGSDFVDNFSKINVITWQNPATRMGCAAVKLLQTMNGYSRDDATLWGYRYKNSSFGCRFTHTST
jgi:hypothetical protein